MRSYKTTKIRGTILSGLVLIALLAFSSTSALASTASNATIRNTVTVDYNDTAGTPQLAVEATADVTINLVAATPTLSAPVDQTTDPAIAAVYNYTITSAANGPDAYGLSALITDETGIGSSGTELTINSIVVTSIDLGASTVATDVTILQNTAVDIVVPSDLDGTDNEVNGIKALDTVIIGTDLFTVNGVTDNGGVGTSIINVTSTTTAGFTALAGSLINEQGTFDLTVTPGTVTTNSPAPTITVDTTVTGSNAVDVTDETITTITVANLSVNKVADVTTASPGDTITYTITVTNNGSSNATAATVTDPVPQFTSYVANSTLLNSITVVGDGATSPLVGGLLVDDDAVRGAGVAATGVIPPASSAIVTFQVTVD